MVNEELRQDLLPQFMLVEVEKELNERGVSLPVRVEVKPELAEEIVYNLRIQKAELRAVLNEWRTRYGPAMARGQAL